MNSGSEPSVPGASASVTLRLLIESLRATGWGRVHLSGQSMWPTLKDGWLVRVSAQPADTLRVGDIGVFVNRGVLTIHRLIWKRVENGRTRYLFQGDNSPVRETVAAEAILGRAVGADGEWIRKGVGLSITVGNDERAFFYRNAYRLHALLSRWLPAARLPSPGARQSLTYRLLRGIFHRLERIFAPRPHRRPL